MVVSDIKVTTAIRGDAERTIEKRESVRPIYAAGETRSPGDGHHHNVGQLERNLSNDGVAVVGNVERSISVHRQPAGCLEVCIIICPIVAAGHSGKSGDGADEPIGAVFC